MRRPSPRRRSRPTRSTSVSRTSRTSRPSRSRAWMRTTTRSSSARRYPSSTAPSPGRRCPSSFSAPTSSRACRAPRTTRARTRCSPSSANASSSSAPVGGPERPALDADLRLRVALAARLAAVAAARPAVDAGGRHRGAPHRRRWRHLLRLLAGHRRGHDASDGIRLRRRGGRPGRVRHDRRVRVRRRRHAHERCAHRRGAPDRHERLAATPTTRRATCTGCRSRRRASGRRPPT